MKPELEMDKTTRILLGIAIACVIILLIAAALEPETGAIVSY